MMWGEGGIRSKKKLRIITMIITRFAAGQSVFYSDRRQFLTSLRRSKNYDSIQMQKIFFLL